MAKSPQIQALEASLDSISNAADLEKLNAIVAFCQTIPNHHDLIRLNPISAPADSKNVDLGHVLSLVEKYKLEKKFESTWLSLSKDRVPVASDNHLKCANHNVNAGIRCNKDASSACSLCRLVSYCSKDCQTANWPTHKKDCKSSLRSPDWKPAWVRDDRSPAFVGGEGGWDGQKHFGIPRSLWGNMLARDILKLSQNEGAQNIVGKPLALAFVASGDLRNMVRTVNELPKDYRGRLTLLINDRDPMVVCRNFIILAALGLIDQERDPAETALHLWYSVFLPETSNVDYTSLFLKHHILLPATPIKMGNATLTVDDVVPRLLYHHLEGTNITKLTPDVANAALREVMMAPERIDYRDRYYVGLEPSHRVAFQVWRQFGLLYPFRSFSGHFKTPNPWLFTREGQLCLPDKASPIQGWDMIEVTKAGKDHGTTKEDLMGCLYFYVKDQLQEFSQRIRRFHINISMTIMDATELASKVRNGSAPGLEVHSFDRIEVSNIVDREYVGVQSVLQNWGSLLNKGNKYSTLIGLFMNWVVHMKGALSQGSNSMEVILKLFQKQFPERMRSMSDRNRFMTTLDDLDVCNENSAFFERFLRLEKENQAAKQVGLQARKINTIVPPRLGCPIGSNRRALPKLQSEEDKYDMFSLYDCTFQERYVEAREDELIYVLRKLLQLRLVVCHLVHQVCI